MTFFPLRQGNDAQSYLHCTRNLLHFSVSGMWGFAYAMRTKISILTSMLTILTCSKTFQFYKIINLLKCISEKKYCLNLLLLQIKKVEKGECQDSHFLASPFPGVLGF